MIDMQRRVWEQDARKEGEIEVTLKYIAQGKVSIEDASEELGVSISELEEFARKKGIKIPQIKVTKEENLYVATDVASGVASQGTTVETALSNLKEALELYYE